MKIWVSENLTSINSNLKFHQFEVEISKQISALKIDISNKIFIDSSNFDLYQNDFLLDNNKSIEYFKINENSIFQLYLLDVYSVNDQGKYLIINLKQFLPNGIKVEQFHVKSDSTIRDFYNQLKREEKILNFKSFFHLNRVLKNDKTFQESKIEDYDEIKLVNNIVLVKYENCLYDTQVIRKVSLKSEKLNDNLIELCKVWNINSNFVAVIYQGIIINEISSGIYLSFISNGNDINDSIIVFVTESLISEVINKHGILLNKSDFVLSAVDKIKRLINIENFDEIKIRFHEKILEMDKRLVDYGISNFSELHVMCRIFIKSLNSNYELPISVCLNDKVSKLNENLFFLGKLIPKEETFSENGILRNSEILMSEKILPICSVTLVDYKECYLTKNSEIDIKEIHEINFNSENVNDNRHKFSLEIKQNYNLININYNEKIIKEIPNGKYLYFIHDENYCESSMIVFVSESLSSSGELKTLAIVINKADKVLCVLERIQTIVDREEELKIRFNEDVLEDNELFSCYDIKNGSELILLMRIFFKDLDGRKYSLFISLRDEILYLKYLISKLKNIKVGEINLHFQSKKLEDEKLCSDYEIDSGTTLMMIATIKGGNLLNIIIYNE